MTTILDKSSPIRVGQRIHTNLYGRGFGTVVAIHGEQRPDSVRHSGVVAFGGRASFDIAFDSGPMTIQLPETILRGVQWQVFDEVAPADAVAAAVVRSQCFKAEEDAKKAEKENAFAAAIEAMRADPNYKHLQQASDKYDGKMAAKNLRAHLKKHFPGVKFSVRTDHNSVYVRWEDGPTVAQVEPIADAFKGGSFDGMEDCYRYERAPFTELFGSFKYVSTRREESEALIAFAVERTFAKWADQLRDVNRQNIEAFRLGEYRDVRVSIPGFWRVDNLQTLIHAVAAKTAVAGEGFAVTEDLED